MSAATRIKIKSGRSLYTIGGHGCAVRRPFYFLLKGLSVFLLTSLLGCSNLSDRGDHAIKSHRDSLPFEIKGFPVPGEFSVERIELTTLNRARNFHRNEELMPIATIQFKGKGTIVGHWTLDGRILEPFYVPLSRGSTVLLQLVSHVNLAALSSGRHSLSMEFSQPGLSFDLPKLEFFVK